MINPSQLIEIKTEKDVLRSYGVSVDPEDFSPGFYNFVQVDANSGYCYLGGIIWFKDRDRRMASQEKVLRWSRQIEPFGTIPYIEAKEEEGMVVRIEHAPPDFFVVLKPSKTRPRQIYFAFFGMAISVMWRCRARLFFLILSRL